MCHAPIRCQRILSIFSLKPENLIFLPLFLLSVTKLFGQINIIEFHFIIFIRLFNKYLVTESVLSMGKASFIRAKNKWRNKASCYVLDKG